MKIIDTKGITYLEPLDGCTHWYWGSDYIHGDLYEAEELFKQKSNIKSNRLLFVRYPEGIVSEPIKPKDNQYFGVPIYFDNHIVILKVDFDLQLIEILNCDDNAHVVFTIASMPLDEVIDCYNLLLRTSPLMLTRHGNEGFFEIVYPYKAKIKISDNESFYFRKDDCLYFSAWYEDPDYHEQIIIRSVNDGNILQTLDGTLKVMPDGQMWCIT